MDALLRFVYAILTLLKGICDTLGNCPIFLQFSSCYKFYTCLHYTGTCKREIRHTGNSPPSSLTYRFWRRQECPGIHVYTLFTHLKSVPGKLLSMGVFEVGLLFKSHLPHFFIFKGSPTSLWELGLFLLFTKCLQVV